MRYRLVMGLAGLLAAAGCAAEGGAAESQGSSSAAREAGEREAGEREVAAPPAPPPSSADSAAERARVAARAEVLRMSFTRVDALGAREVAELRQDLNAEQVASAQRLGVRASGEGEIRRLVREGRLVALGDSTEWWVLRDMDHSTPYVTPDARAALVALGRRFHARLDSAGLPRYRMKVTSALRTSETQEELRKINSYASQTTSAHEFGTTVDVSHERFAVPPGPDGAAGRSAALWAIEEEMLEEEGKVHAKALQALLGRAIAELRDQGALYVMMENRQPVYHMTIARPFSGAAR